MIMNQQVIPCVPLSLYLGVRAGLPEKVMVEHGLEGRGGRVPHRRGGRASQQSHGGGTCRGTGWGGGRGGVGGPGWAGGGGPCGPRKDTSSSE